MYRNRKFGAKTVSNLAAQKSVENSQQNSLNVSRVLAEINGPPAKVQRLDKPLPPPPEDDLFAEDLESDDVIPASQQPPSQLYISQRNILCRTSSKTQSRMRLPTSYYETVLMKCGVDLDKPNAFHLSIDHNQLVKKLRTILMENPENPQNFLKALEENIKDSNLFIKLLSGVLLNLNNSEIICQSPESIMKHLLLIDILQKDLIEILFNKMKLIIVNEKETNYSEPPILLLILCQLKFINHVTNGEIVSKNIYEILELANPLAREIIITNFEDIFDRNMHDEVIQKLMTLIPNDEELLTAVSVNTFGNMCLSHVTLSDLKNKIIHFMKDGATIALWAPFVKFLLNFGKDDSINDIQRVISNLRECLDWKSLECSEEAKNTNKLTIFNCIYNTLKGSKKIFEAWTKAILGVSTSSEHNSMDLLILIIMMSVNDEKCNFLELNIRRRISSGCFSIKLLEEMSSEFSLILTKYSKYLLEMIDVFFRDKNFDISNFAYTGYRLMFNSSDSRKFIISKLVAYVCLKSQPADLVSTQTDLTTRSLLLLNEIKSVYLTDMQNNGLQILRILDCINNLTLAQYRLAINLICSLAYPLPPLNGSVELQDHIHMIIKKQMGSSVLSLKRQGIVGAIQVVKNISWISEDSLQNSCESDTSVQTISNLPDGQTRNAAILLKDIFRAANSSPELLALSYDELSSVFSTKNFNIDRQFLIWFSDYIVGHFQQDFVQDMLPDDLGLEVERVYCINNEEEASEVDGVMDIAINISGLTIKPKNTANITTLPSLFNLLRTLIHKKSNDLASVSAVLGCAIILPKIMNSGEDVNIFNEFDEQQSKQIMDIYFHTANWFREIISAFASESADVREKLLLRLSELIRIEEKISELLIMASPEYFPPVCQFLMNSPSSDVGKFKKPSVPKAAAAKKKSKVPEPDSEGMSILATARSQSNTTLANFKGKSKKVNCLEVGYAGKEMYRQMDLTIVCILAAKLEIKFPLPEEMIGKCMGLQEFRFILSDTILKLESVNGVGKFKADQNLQYINSPETLIFDLIQVLDCIRDFFIQLTTHLKTTLNAANGKAKDKTLFTEEITQTKICAGLCLRFFASLFTWPGFQKKEHLGYLNAALKLMTKKSGQIATSDLSVSCLKLIQKFSETVLDLKSAVHFYHFVKAISGFVDNNSKDALVVEICGDLLGRTWYSLEGKLERGTDCNVLLDELLKGLFHNGDISFVKNQIKMVFKEMKNLDFKDGVLKSFPSFHKANFPLLFRTLCGALIISITKKTETTMASQNYLKLWERGCEHLNTLLEIVKKLDIPRNLSLFLKHSHLFLKIFLQHGMPTVEQCLKTNADRVIDLLKSLQVTTRYLHCLCCESKKIQNSSILAQIPFLRQTIETLLLKVQAALVANNCSLECNFGNLKNKDLEGEEILSQTMLSADVNEEEEFPSDDETISDDVGQILARRVTTSEDRAEHNDGHSMAF